MGHAQKHATHPTRKKIYFAAFVPNLFCCLQGNGGQQKHVTHPTRKKDNLDM